MDTKNAYRGGSIEKVRNMQEGEDTIHELNFIELRYFRNVGVAIWKKHYKHHKLPGGYRMLAPAVFLFAGSESVFEYFDIK